jgi:hypothetical protein
VADCFEYGNEPLGTIKGGIIMNITVLLSYFSRTVLYGVGLERESSAYYLRIVAAVIRKFVCYFSFLCLLMRMVRNIFLF